MYAQAVGELHEAEAAPENTPRINLLQGIVIKAARLVYPELESRLGLSDKQMDRAMAVLEKIPLGDALPGTEAFSVARGDVFAVPEDPDRIQSSVGLQMAWTVHAADSIALRGSWLWTLARESALLFGGMRGSAGRETARLYGQSSTGPLAMLLILSSPVTGGFDADLRGLFVKAALDRMSADAVIGDLKLFNEGADTIASRAGPILIHSLQRMAPADVEALSLLLPVRFRTSLVDFAAALRAAPDESASAAIPRAVKQIWEPQLRAALEDSLKQMLPPPRPAPARSGRRG